MHTYGNSRKKLIENGYVPASALRPGIAQQHVIADDLGAVLLVPGFGNVRDVPNSAATCISLNVGNTPAAADIIAALAKRGIEGGPVRTDSGGARAFLVRWDERHTLPPFTDERVRSGEPVFAISTGHRNGPGELPESEVIRLDGDWVKSPLEIPYAKLPGITEDSLAAIRAAVDVIIEAHYPTPDYVAPSPTPEMLAARRAHAALHAEWAKRDNVVIRGEVERRIHATENRAFAAPWERKVFSGEALIREQVRLYDVIVQERATPKRKAWA